MSTKAKRIVCVAILLSLAVGSIYTNYSQIETREKEMKTSKLVYDTRKYYYNQLTLEEQILYDNIEDSKEKIMKNQEVCIGQMESPYEEAAEKAKNTLNKVVWAYRLDNPICTIWFDHYKRYLITRNSGDDIATFDIMIRPRDNGYHYFESQKELEEAIQEVETKVEKFVSQLSGTEEEKLRSIHDWILQDTLYDESLEHDNINNIYGGIIQKICVCGGLAYSFKYVADKAGMSVVSTLGRCGTEKEENSSKEINHVWNEMMIDGEWECVDLTGDLANHPGDKPQDNFFKFCPESLNYHAWKVFKNP